MTTLAADNLTVNIDGRAIVSAASLDVAAGEIVGLVGPNGAGKSTLLRALVGLTPISGGTVRIDGADRRAMRRSDQARKIAYLPQGQTLHWRLEARQVTALGRLPHTSAARPMTAADEAAIDRALDQADIAALAARKVDTLSGGERARVMLSRALAVEAPLLLADEPVAALDPYHALQIMEMLRGLAKDGRGVLIVLHDLTLALRFCDRLVLMRDGKITASGAPCDVLAADQLAAAYDVSGIYGEADGQAYVVPWKRLETPR
jgi:iron complex transport system ATP-binding protein